VEAPRLGLILQCSWSTHASSHTASQSKLQGTCTHTFHTHSHTEQTAGHANTGCPGRPMQEVSGSPVLLHGAARNLLLKGSTSVYSMRHHCLLLDAGAGAQSTTATGREGGAHSGCESKPEELAYSLGQQSVTSVHSTWGFTRWRAGSRRGRCKWAGRVKHISKGLPGDASY